MGEPAPKKNLNKVIVVTFMIGMILFVTGYATDYWTDTDISHSGLWRHCTLDACTEGSFSEVFKVLKEENLKVEIRKKRQAEDIDPEVRDNEHDRERERDHELERNTPEHDEEETHIRTQKVVVHHHHRHPVKEVRREPEVFMNTNEINTPEEIVEEKEGWFEATQAFETLGFIAAIVALVLIVLYVFVPQTSGKKIVFILAMLACFAAAGCIILGIIIYGSKMDNLSWSFALCCIAGIIFGISGILLVVDMLKR